MAFEWRDEDDETIEYHFNPRLTIPNVMDLLSPLPERSAAARQSLTANLDVRYGDRPKENLDIFPAEGEAMGTPPPAQIFIHGGYWRMMDKSDYSHLATDIVKQGITHISLNYDLCPEVTVDDIVGEIRNAIIYIYENAKDLGVDRDRLFLTGHSAGGHLTGMMLKQDWPAYGLPADVFKGAMPTSGVFEPEAIMHTSINEDVRLDVAMAEKVNVLTGPPRCGGPVLAVVGGDEPEGFHKQSEIYIALCRENGLDADLMVVDGCNHFTVADDVFMSGGGAFERFLQIIKEA